MNEEVYQHILFLQMHHNHDEYSNKQRMPKKKGEESSGENKKKERNFSNWEKTISCVDSSFQKFGLLYHVLKNVAILMHAIVKISILLFIPSIPKSTYFVGLSFNYYFLTWMMFSLAKTVRIESGLQHMAS